MNQLDPEQLYKDYEPLRRAVAKKFTGMMHTHADKEDLYSNINTIFIQLVNEYNPRRGVDFPFYIKKMLELRTYHYITKYLKTINNEVCEEDFIIEDASYDDDIQTIIDLCSIDPDIQLGTKHRRLMTGLMVEKKTLKELADEEGVPVDRLHARLYFLIKKLRKEHEAIQEIYGEDLY